MQGIPLIMFEHCLHIPMDPFHLAMYEAIGCRITQPIPNAVAQISDFIALCDEKDIIPSIWLFFSIYGISYQNEQVYFDTRSKRSKIVSVRSSNSGYHSKWVYVYGPDLEFVRPCRKVTRAAIDYLHNLEKYDIEYLDSFQGSRPEFTHLDLKDNSFLEAHHRKTSLLSL